LITFASAKIVKKHGMTTKKICFLVAFLAFLAGINAQTVDKQNGKGEKVYYVKIETS
jgi:hypothetical protein